MAIVRIEWNLAPATGYQTIQGPGLYMVNDSQYSHGADCLVWIGKAEQQAVGARIQQNNSARGSNWIERGRSIVIRSGHLATDDYARIGDCEKLLIWVHQPVYNDRHKSHDTKLNPPQLSSPLLIYNLGDFGRLLPIVASDYPWFNFPRPMVSPSSD